MAKAKRQTKPDVSHIEQSIQHLAAPIADLKSDPANTRKHPERNLETIKGSLAGFRQQKPIIVDAKGIVVAGNGTLEAARALGWTHIAVARTTLKGSEARAYAISDNRSAELAEWDDAALAETLAALQLDESIDEALTGFDDKEINQLINKTAGIVEDEVPEPPVDPITKPGDLWLLGKHRLLCGDSTKAEDVKRVMSGERASMVFTDPPYGMKFQSNMRTASPKFEVLKNDDHLLTGWIEHVANASTGWVFVWTTWKVLKWLPAVRPFGALSNMVVWHKGGGGIGGLGHTFSTDYELAIVFNRGAELCGKRIGSVWTFNKDAASTYEHPTQKPVALAAEAIDKTTRSGSLILDAFCGSGTTIIAAEQLNRRCYGIEISPAYCDVIVTRWEKLTGLKAELSGAAT